jgi:hypothetical protein
LNTDPLLTAAVEWVVIVVVGVVSWLLLVVLDVFPSSIPLLLWLLVVFPNKVRATCGLGGDGPWIELEGAAVLLLGWVVNELVEVVPTVVVFLWLTPFLSP